jgi:type VI secretion system protein
MTVTLKFQSSGTVPGNARPVRMQGGNLTVGRGPANDLVLPDPGRMLSKSHFVIEDHNGNVVIVDLSTNGTFLNYSKIPLGRVPTPLNNGDVLCLGAYELVVEIGGDLPDLQSPIAAPAASVQVSPGIAEHAPDPLRLLDDAAPGGDFLDDLLGAEDGPTGPSQLNPVDPIDELLPPLGEEEDPFFQKPADGREGAGASQPMHSPMAQDSFSPQVPARKTIPDDWDEDLPGGGSSTARPARPPEPEPTLRPAMADPAPTVSNPVSNPVPGQAGPPSAGDSAAAQAFLLALGVQDVKIEDLDPATTMGRMGRVMKTLITGLREILMTRTSIKSEFRIEQTMINVGGNNPLKFSISPEQAIEAMVRPAVRGYLDPEIAAAEALDDIKAHEIAMVTGMEAALKGVLAKLNPELLAGQIESSGAFGSLLRGKKARYWEVYEKIYAEISDQAENDFHDLFSREFARAYKEQLDRLK